MGGQEAGDWGGGGTAVLQCVRRFFSLSSLG